MLKRTRKRHRRKTALEPPRKYHRILKDGKVPLILEHRLVWPQTDPISRSTQNFVLNSLLNRGSWGEIPSRSLASVVRRTHLNVAQIRSFYTWGLIEKAKKRHRKLVPLAKIFHKRYKSGEDIIKLSCAYDFPPVGIFRAILVNGGMSKKRVKFVLQNPQEFLSPHDQAQLRRAFDHDITQSHSAKRLEAGQNFEDSIEKILKVNGIQYQTEKDLAEEQIKSSGCVIATPDFLFRDLVTIQGHQARWIECKSFTGASLPTLKHNILCQLEKYVHHWGPGAVIFRYGYVDDFPVPSSVLRLDAGPFEGS